MNFVRSEGTDWRAINAGKEWKTGVHEDPELEKSHGQECRKLLLPCLFARLSTGDEFLTPHQFRRSTRAARPFHESALPRRTANPIPPPAPRWPGSKPSSARQKSARAEE